MNDYREIAAGCVKLGSPRKNNSRPILHHARVHIGIKKEENTCAAASRGPRPLERVGVDRILCVDRSFTAYGKSPAKSGNFDVEGANFGLYPTGDENHEIRPFAPRRGAFLRGWKRLEVGFRTLPRANFGSPFSRTGAKDAKFSRLHNGVRCSSGPEEGFTHGPPVLRSF
jgi:hypothetical protein